MTIAFPSLLLAASLAAAAENGVALIKGTTDGSAVSGTVAFEQTREGLKVRAALAGVPPGEHGFHIHEFGDCGDAGKAAGGHYNPTAAKHGHAVKEGVKKAHAGDLGNIVAAADGTARLEAVLAKVSLAGGKHAVAGRAVIVHEKADDFSQPAGNAGGRLACGVITLAPHDAGH